ncbi:MAG TPA: hypothetical protein DHW15_03205 [Bacteroidetes bacterium]|nr:hypothetical protein [Bacteroidota bacterium]
MPKPTACRNLCVLTPPKAYKKSHLPEKICLVCGRPFNWRKKWARNWEEVKYCSDACRKKRRYEGKI